MLLDSGPLGLLANPTTRGPARELQDWARGRAVAGDRLVVPAIADYEVRRELLRAGLDAGLRRLDVLCSGLDFVPLTTAALRIAASLWADARNSGAPAAHDAALDGDVILAGQARTLVNEGEVVVITTNVRHLARYVDARRWTDV